jgi:hypothetical protein
LPRGRSTPSKRRWPTFRSARRGQARSRRRRWRGAAIVLAGSAFFVAQEESASPAFVPAGTFSRSERHRISDQEVPVELIIPEFGKPVSDIVMEVTDDKNLPKEERKHRQSKPR